MRILLLIAILLLQHGCIVLYADKNSVMNLSSCEKIISKRVHRKYFYRYVISERRCK